MAQTPSSEPAKKENPKAEQKKAEKPAETPANFSEEDREILAKGEISRGQYIAGGVVGSAVGFGIGHAIQGRYGELGWVFTTGEVISYGFLIRSLRNCVDIDWYDTDEDDTSCVDKGMLKLSVVGLFGFKIWEVIDVWTAPPAHNRRYRQLKGATPEKTKFYILPAEKGMTAGLAFSF